MHIWFEVDWKLLWSRSEVIAMSFESWAKVVWKLIESCIFISKKLWQLINSQCRENASNAVKSRLPGPRKGRFGTKRPRVRIPLLRHVWNPWISKGFSCYAVLAFEGSFFVEESGLWYKDVTNDKRSQLSEISESCCDKSNLRYSRGVYPEYFLKVRLKYWELSPKPVSRAISWIIISGWCIISRIAVSILRSKI